MCEVFHEPIGVQCLACEVRYGSIRVVTQMWRTRRLHPRKPTWESRSIASQRTKTGGEQSQQDRRLFDHFVSVGEQRQWHGEAERLRGPEVDHEIESGRKLDR